MSAFAVVVHYEEVLYQVYVPFYLYLSGVLSQSAEEYPEPDLSQ